MADTADGSTRRDGEREPAPPDSSVPAERAWKAFEVTEELDKLVGARTPYREFLRVPSLSCGVYRLPAGAKDLQAPHDEDEVYFVLSGRGKVRIAGKERVVGRGSILYVRATAEHSFFEIEEEVTLLVFFASGGPSDDEA